MMKRRFSELSSQEALHVAIFIEERNAEIYEQFAQLFEEFKDPESLEIAHAFEDMAEEERHHGSMLQEVYTARFGTQSCVITEEEIREVIELPKLDNVDLFAVVRSGTVSSRALALQVGLDAEKSALRFYVQLADCTHDPELRKLYTELAEFEVGHAAELQMKMNAARKSASGQEC
jgi:rubrerythrin